MRAMRRNIIIGYGRFLITLLIVSVLASCSSFLEENPEDRYVLDNFYNNADDATAAVNAIYAQLYDVYKRRMYLMADLPTDDHKNGKGMPNSYLLNLEYLRFTPENQYVREMWQYNYEGIMRANAAILNIPGVKMEETLKKRLLGEARFLRALFYFNLVRFYGDVPLVNKTFTLHNIQIVRNPKEEVYASIIDDLSYAEVHLPQSYDTSDMGRVTCGAAKVLLGKVFLTTQDFQEAADKLLEVIFQAETYGYGLHDDYGDNWREDTENGQERILSIEYMEDGGESNNQMALCGPKFSIHNGAGVPGLKGAKEADIPTVELYNAYSVSDERKQVTFKLDYLSPTDGQIYTAGIPLFGKYWEEGQTQLTKSAVNMHILRYADALLMLSEALNEVGQTELGLSYLNQVRQRAFNDLSHNYEGLSKEEFREAVWLERRLELALEGHRWFDLVRSGRWVVRMREHGQNEAALSESNKIEITENIREYMVLMPIPQYEINLNPDLEQNPGY